MFREESSGQQAPESSHDVVNEIRHILERLEHRLALDNAQMVERYIEGEAHIIVHFRVNGSSEEFVAYYQRDSRSDRQPQADLGDLRMDTGRQLDAAQDRPRCDQQLMLVDVVQRVQLPESMALPSLVRFGCIDCVYYVLRNALYCSATHGWVIRGGRCDRVIHAPIRRRATASRQYELVGGMVEGLSEVLQYIGGNGCQFIRHVTNSGNVVDANPDLRVGATGFAMPVRAPDLVGSVTGLRLFLGVDSMWASVVEGIERKLQILDVLFGPCDFRPNSGDDTAHKL